MSFEETLSRSFNRERKAALEECLAVAERHRSNLRHTHFLGDHQVEITSHPISGYDCVAEICKEISALFKNIEDQKP